MKRRFTCLKNIRSASSTTSRTASWERGAKLVKDTNTRNKYLEHIRDTHDPSLHLKTLEDELKGTMSKALGNQGGKVVQLLSRLDQERARYDEILSHSRDYDPSGNIKCQGSMDLSGLSHSSKSLLFKTVQNHNRLRKQALDARWELLVHRQAVGFITNNHKFVHEKFPIPDMLELPGNDEDWKDIHNDAIIQDATSRKNVNKEGVVRNFGDQLDWWERIGRWK